MEIEQIRGESCATDCSQDDETCVLWVGTVDPKNLGFLKIGQRDRAILLVGSEGASLVKAYRQVAHSYAIANSTEPSAKMTDVVT
ncbi:unnamed protein product [Schistocephalus solidus]|uniref:DUF4174 domain-containing protein n=1 Tax=Schistocephalus solidus TaxID=70667 RepID=A0A183S810_SCHSO|nr:unnamed protein product [Schistocephalus solidus]